MNRMLSALKSLEQPAGEAQRRAGTAPRQPAGAERVSAEWAEQAQGEKRNHALADSAERLRDQLLRELPAERPLLLGWLSLEEHAQSADLLLELARQLAAALRGEILLVDADDRRRTLTRRCGLRGHAGLAEVLRSEQAVPSSVCGVPGDPVCVLPGGNPTRTSLDTPSRIGRFTRAVRHPYRQCLLDLGDGRSATALAIARQCDFVYPLVRLGQTRRSDLLSRLDQWRAIGVPLGGCAVVPSKET